MSQAPKRRIGPFELERKLGSGGMGIVYLATYVKTGQRAALKVLSPAMSSDPKLLARFEREMAILQKLRHPHIVRYFGGGKSSGQHYYAMELLTGGTLDDLLKKKRRLPWEQSIEIGLQVCQALAHAHQHGVIHRDLKPANLFLGEGGTLKLGDFGIARDTQATALTADGRTVGTYAYMAPEQIKGKPPISPKTDLYALGCVLYQVIAGQTPFEADTAAGMLVKHLEEEPDRVTTLAIDCPVWLESIVMRLLEKDPQDRYYDALAVQAALEEVSQKVAEQQSIAKQTVAGGTAATKAANRSEMERLLKKKRRTKRSAGPIYERAWFLSVCLLMLIAGLTWLMWPMGEAELFTRANVLMETGDRVAWMDAREKYLEPYLERFPNGRHARQVRDYVDLIEMDTVERQVRNRARLNREPESEAERLYVEAWRLEQFGDRLLAMEKYRGLAELFAEDPDSRALVNLARRQTRVLQSAAGGQDDRYAFVNQRMREAERHFANGRKAASHAIWSSVVTLYGHHREFEDHVVYARARLDGRDAEPPDFGSESPAATSSLGPSDEQQDPQEQ